ncbi:MAG: hypothetical protein IT368_07325 [Candidatus Hydrogenedentes bacterium]|nr:hypothetical protein [Candidatus Hydrogenedentota bacterium]
MAKSGTRILRSLFLRMFIVTILAGAAAAFFSLQIPNSYRARTLLILAPLPFEHVDETVTQVAVGPNPRPRANYLRVSWLEELPMEDYKMLLTGEEMALAVRDKMVELYKEKGVDASGLTIEKVRRSMEVRIKIFKQTSEELEYQHVIELLLTAGNAEVAAQASNFWAEKSIEYALEMRQLARDGALEFLENQIAEVNKLLDTARDGIVGLEQEADLDGLRMRLAELQQAATQSRLDESDLAEEAVSLEAEIETLEQTNADQLSSAGQRTVEERLLLARGELAGLRARQKALEEQQAALTPEVDALRKRVAEQEKQKNQYALEVSYYERQLEELEMSHYAARMTAADMKPEFKMASPAVPPEEKIAPWRSLIVLVAMFLACAAVPVHFFTMYALRRYTAQIAAQENA